MSDASDSITRRRHLELLFDQSPNPKEIQFATVDTKRGKSQELQDSGGDERIRTSEALLTPAPLAGECLRPLGHISVHILVGPPRVELGTNGL